MKKKLPLKVYNYYDAPIMQNIKIKIGTRGSKLALIQANHVKSLLESNNPHLEAEIIVIKTTGDKILDRNLNEIGGKGLFIKEIEERLLDGSIDMAVHSCKDMPAFLPDNMILACILEREDARDAFISNKYSNISVLPEGAVVGTSSPRRAAQALNLRPDLKIVSFRGNIHTRLEKIKKNEVDATFLASAGLKRSKIEDDSIHIIDPKQMVPAIGQGAICVEIMQNRDDLAAILAPLNHLETEIRVNCERAFLKKFEGSCRTPVAAYSVINGDEIEVDYLIARTDGSEVHRTSKVGKIEDAVRISEDVADELLAKIDDSFFKAV